MWSYIKIDLGGRPFGLCYNILHMDKESKIVYNKNCMESNWLEEGQDETMRFDLGWDKLIEEIDDTQSVRTKFFDSENEVIKKVRNGSWKYDRICWIEGWGFGNVNVMNREMKEEEEVMRMIQIWVDIVTKK